MSVPRYAPRNRVLIYKPSTDTWLTSDSNAIAPLRDAVSYADLILMEDGRVMVMGGSLGSFFDNSLIPNWQIYNPTNRTIGGQAPNTCIRTSAMAEGGHATDYAYLIYVGLTKSGTTMTANGFYPRALAESANIDPTKTKIIIQFSANAANNGTFQVLSISADGSTVTYTNAAGVVEEPAFATLTYSKSYGRMQEKGVSISGNRILTAFGSCQIQGAAQVKGSSDIVIYTPGTTIVSSAYTDDSWEYGPERQHEGYVNLNQCIYTQILKDRAGDVYIFGGVTPANNASSQVLKYDVTCGTLTTQKHLPLRSSPYSDDGYAYEWDGSAVSIFGFHVMGFSKSNITMTSDRLLLTNVHAVDFEQFSYPTSNLDSAIYTPGAPSGPCKKGRQPTRAQMIAGVKRQKGLRKQHRIP